MNLVALHGFWGAPADFDRLVAGVQPERVWIPDLFQPGALDASHGFAEWTENFLSELRSRFSGPVHLVGYSQGGRLALHALLADPERFHRTVLLAAHPGQLAGGERQARERWLETWRVKFRQEQNWDALVHDWNAQPLFGGGSEAKRRMDREILVQALENWSVLRHAFDWNDLRRLTASVCWAFGDRDSKYLAVRDELERRRLSVRTVVIENCGHRILVDQPEAAARLLREEGKHGE